MQDKDRVAVTLAESIACTSTLQGEDRVTLQLIASGMGTDTQSGVSCILAGSHCVYRLRVFSRNGILQHCTLCIAIHNTAILNLSLGFL